MLGISGVMEDSLLVPTSLQAGMPRFALPDPYAQAKGTEGKKPGISARLSAYIERGLGTLLGWTGVPSAMAGKEHTAMISQNMGFKPISFGYMLNEPAKRETTLPYIKDLLFPGSPSYLIGGEGTAPDRVSPAAFEGKNLYRALEIMGADTPEYRRKMAAEGITRVVLTTMPFYYGGTECDGYRTGNAIKLNINGRPGEAKARFIHELFENPNLSHPEVCEYSLGWAERNDPDPEALRHLHAYRQNLHD